MQTDKPRIDRFVDWFIRSEHMREFGSSNDDWLDDSERMERCDRAAEFGADGSTHRERIDDMRRSFRDWLCFGRTKRNPFSAGYDRFAVAVEAHFDRVEQWHTDHGSIDVEIG